MPIVNYELKAVQDTERTFSDEQISDRNKEHLRRFLIVYDVCAARKCIFFRGIKYLLYATEDMALEMNDRDRINRIFADLKIRYRPATYATIVNVSLRYVRWLNEGEKPIGFKDIKSPPKKSSRRDLNAEDMVTWKEGWNLVNATNDLQLKAAFLVQLDCGFRPSEFIDLRFGDVQIKEHMALILVRNGKTGSRHVFLHRSLGVLKQWMAVHPTRKAGDPLWVSEKSQRHRADQDTVRNLSYEALRKRIRTVAKRLGYEKPLDFYNLRHSSCVLDKLDNLPVDLAAERHGHSPEFYTAVYGRLSTRDLINRVNKHYGLADQSERETTAHLCCPQCRIECNARNRFCGNCGSKLHPASGLLQSPPPSMRETNSASQVTCLSHELKQET